MATVVSAIIVLGDIPCEDGRAGISRVLVMPVDRGYTQFQKRRDR